MFRNRMWLRGKQHTSRSIITVPTMHGSGHAVAQHHRSKHCVTHFLGSLARPRAATRVRLAPAMVPLRHDITHQAIVSFPHLGFLHYHAKHDVSRATPGNKTLCAQYLPGRSGPKRLGCKRCGMALTIPSPPSQSCLGERPSQLFLTPGWGGVSPHSSGWLELRRIAEATSSGAPHTQAHPRISRHSSSRPTRAGRRSVRPSTSCSW